MLAIYTICSSSLHHAILAASYNFYLGAASLNQLSPSFQRKQEEGMSKLKNKEIAKNILASFIVLDNCISYMQPWASKDKSSSQVNNLGAFYMNSVSFHSILLVSFNRSFALPKTFTCPQKAWSCGLEMRGFHSNHCPYSLYACVKIN